MGVLGDVLVQSIHVLPAILLAIELQPGGHVQEAGTGRGRVGHHDGALVDGLGQVLPGLGARQVALLGFDGVEADGGAPDVQPHPGRRRGLVAVVARQFLEALGRVGRQHPFLLEQFQARRSQPGDHVGLRVAFFGQRLGGDDAGGVAHVLQFDIGRYLGKALGVRLEGLDLPRCVDGEGGLLGQRRAGGG
jgi:hypothetical protein